MRQSAASPAPAGRTAAPAPTTTRLHGRRLALVRAAWAALTLLSLVSFITRLPFYLARLAALCATAPCAYEQITSASLQALQQVGLTLGGYALLAGGLTLASALFNFALAALIVWRRSDDWLALLVALAQVFWGSATIMGVYALGLQQQTLGSELFPAPPDEHPGRRTLFAGLCALSYRVLCAALVLRPRPRRACLP